MSLSTEAKKELCSLEINWECCLTAALSAVIHTASILSFSSDGLMVVIDSLSQDVFNFVNAAVEKLYGVTAQLQDGKPIICGEFVTDMLLSLKILQLKQIDQNSDVNNYASDINGSIDTLARNEPANANDYDADNLNIHAKNAHNYSNPLSDADKNNTPIFAVIEGIDQELTDDECCKKAYIVGAFIGCGSIGVAHGYHLEFSCTSRRLRDGLIWLLDGFGIKAGEATTRNGKCVAYIKDKDLISDFLALLGAGKTVLKLNQILVRRSVRQDAARAANCDEANLNRLVNASTIQQEAIKKLGNIKNRKLSEVATVRVKHPDLSYDELALIMGVSKSTVKYRLNRLVDMANALDD